MAESRSGQGKYKKIQLHLVPDAKRCSKTNGVTSELHKRVGPLSNFAVCTHTLKHQHKAIVSKQFSTHNVVRNTTDDLTAILDQELSWIKLGEAEKFS